MLVTVKLDNNKLYCFLGGQLCIEKVDIRQDGGNQLSCNRLGIVPSLNFTCNGTISGIMAGVMKIFDEN